MRLSPLLAAPLFLFACGSPAATAPPSSTPEAATPTAAPAPGPCTATQATVLTANTEEIGTAIVHLAADGCTVELRTPAGPVTPAPTCNKEQPRPSMREAACRLGGDVYVPDRARSDEKAGTIFVSIARFKHQDPKADLALICTPFAALKEPGSGRAFGDMPTLDPSQRARVRAEVLGDGLTSHEWRLWLAAMSDDHERAASVAKLRDAAKAAGIDCQAEWLLR